MKKILLLILPLIFLLCSCQMIELGDGKIFPAIEKAAETSTQHAAADDARNSGADDPAAAKRHVISDQQEPEQAAGEPLTMETNSAASDNGMQGGTEHDQAPIINVIPAQPPVAPEEPNHASIDISGFKKVSLNSISGSLNVNDSDSIVISGAKASDGSMRGNNGEIAVSGVIVVKENAKATLVLDNVNIDTNYYPGLYIGNGAYVKLILKGTNKLLGDAWNSAVEISENATLEICSIDGRDSGGSLFTEGSWAAAISTARKNADSQGGTLIVNSGTVDAVGSWAAAIGGTYEAPHNGSVIINGGDVRAVSSYGAAIGGGSNTGYHDGSLGISAVGGSGGTITINGGKVSASSSCGAGLGGGCSITGSDADGAAIGGAGGNITITGGTVNAKSRQGADIGGGYASTGGGGAVGGDTGNVIITGGDVKGQVGQAK